MARVDILKPVYVQYIPPADSIKAGELYISLEFQTTVHKCCCGCGLEVVTPLNHAQWKISNRNGKVSIYPSIGNWSYPCQSHYFIRDNRVVWAEAFSEAAIKRVQASDKQALDRYIANQNAVSQRPRGFPRHIFAAFSAAIAKIRELFRGNK